MANHRPLTLENWQFIRLMQALDEEIALSPNQGKGSLAYQFMEKHQERFLMLEARLIDAANRNIDRFTRLMLDEKISFAALSYEETALIKHILQKIIAQKTALLATTDDHNDTVELSFEQQNLQSLLQSI